MKKFLEKSELIIKFCTFKFFSSTLIFLSLFLIFPDIEQKIWNMNDLGGILFTSILVFMILGYTIYVGIMCYSLNIQSLTSINDIKTQEEMEIFQHQKFLLKLIPFSPTISLIPIELGDTFLLAISVFMIYSMYSFYRNHMALKALFNL